jgi:ribosomal protein L4
MAKLKVYNMKKDAVGDIELNDGVFAVEYNEALVKANEQAL